MKISTRFALVGLAMAVVFGVANSANAAYDFLKVTSTGTLTSQFTSQNGNGFITVTDSFSPGGAALLENVNSAIFPSQFQTLFPGTGQVEGHLFQENINSTSVATFDLTNYNLSSSTVFGLWNIIDELAPVYRMELIDTNNVAHAPTGLHLIGNQDNETQVAGRRQIVLDQATGNFLLGAVINPNGTHTDAAFYDNIPLNTAKIVIYGNLPRTNTGDGVGYYFAEQTSVPEPGTLAIWGLGLTGVVFVRRRKSRQLAN